MSNLRVGCVSYGNRQGIAWIMKRFYDAGVVTHPLVYRHSHPSRPMEPGWYPEDTPVIEPVNHRNFSQLPAVREWLGGLDLLLTIETPFDWGLYNVAKQLGVRTCLMPMHEWTPVTWPVKPDCILAPSLLDLDYFRDEFPGAIAFLPVPVVNSTWQLRERAVRFLHNAGNVGHREHKGTRQLVEAVPLVRNPDFRLTVMAQDKAALESILDDALGGRHDPRLTVDVRGNDVPWERMWDDHDAYVAPEKLNGLSLPLAEAYAAGLVVITTDRYPANTWLPNKHHLLDNPDCKHGDDPMLPCACPGLLIPPASKFQACISRNYRPFEECIVEPATIAAKIDEWVGRDIREQSLAAREWGERNSWAALAPRYNEVLAAFAAGDKVSEKPVGDRV